MHKKILSLILVLCLAFGMLPTSLAAPATAAERSPMVLQVTKEGLDENDEGGLIKALKDAGKFGPAYGGVIIEISENITLTRPAVFPHDVDIILRSVSGKHCTITADANFDKPEYVALFHIPSYTTYTDNVATIQISDITLDAGGLVRALYAGKNTQVLLGRYEASGNRNTKLRNGFVSTTSTNGGALRADPGSRVYAANVSFENNTADSSNGTSGGAVYLYEAAGYLRNCTFKGNSAHSGGAIYSYGGNTQRTINGDTVTGMPLLVDGCIFGTNGEKNFADQRGGAIHCHGNAIIRNTTISGQYSSQNGGGIYISSQTGANNVQGKLFLQNSKITGNVSAGNGGGIYIADGGTLYLYGTETTVSGNQIDDKSGIPAPYKNSNVFYSGSGCKIIAGSGVSLREGKDSNGIQQGGVGVSTSNPFTRKLAIYSGGEMNNNSEEMIALEKLIESVEALSWVEPKSLDWSKTYSMADEENHNDYKNYFYDSDVWRLVTKPFSPEGDFGPLFDTSTVSTTDPNVREGNMWLILDPDYISESTGGSSTVTVNAPCVVFDYNLPGAKAEIRDKLKEGSTVDLPDVSGDTKNGVEFVFKGWYDQPAEGTKQTKPITVTKNMGIKVYYAQWDIIPPDHEIDPIPGVEQMYLAYFYLNYDGGGFTSSYIVAGDFTFTVHYTIPGPDGPIQKTKTIPVEIPWSWPGRPHREGYDFVGWALSENGTPVDTTTWTPTKVVTTFYARWTPHNWKITWDANEGQGGGTTYQDYGTAIIKPADKPTREGYDFTGWYVDKGYTIPLTSGTLMEDHEMTFFAGWTPKEYAITWDTNYTGGSVTTVTQYYGQLLKIPEDPIRNGYKFNGWLEKDDDTYADPNDTVTGNKTYIAQWGENEITYTVTVEWKDFNDNDAVRPKSITVTLMQNGIPMEGARYTQTITSDWATQDNPNKWVYDFKNLPETDVVSNPITYSVAITSSVPDEYVYRVENNSKTAGYILLTHSLITRDVDAYVVWDDNNNQDGRRPATVTLQLGVIDDSPEGYHNVEGSESRVTLSGGGDTWFYRFHDVQKYYTNKKGDKGVEIPYIIVAEATNDGELAGYTDDYHEYTHIFHYTTAEVSREVIVGWQDSNNQDGKRPASMSVQLYADNVPLEGKTVTLSDANGWSYKWDNLPMYADGGREVVYSARVISSLVDYTASSMGMTIEMSYVPSSTSIPAFITWVDENDADGLRPDYVIAELLAGDVPTGDTQVLSATNGWTATWSNYSIYKDGERIEYKFKVVEPQGYTATHYGVYDKSGLSAVLTHERLKQDLTGNIEWDDRNDQSGGRMARVAVLLYADGSVIDADNKVWISAEDGWEHIFSNLPIYRDHGQEIKYSMVLASDPGKYVPTTSKMTITMRLEPEFVEVPVQIIWEDNNNSDGARPSHVAVSLLVDGQPSGKTMSATALTDWAVNFVHLDRYGANGLYTYTTELAEVPEGYAVSYPSDGMVVLKRVAQTKDVTANIIWQDNDDQYSQRPSQVTLTLYADRLDGSGPQNTGRVEKCKASEDWAYTFEGVPALHNGKNIIYSVVASGNLPNYTISYDGMDVYMTHKGYTPGDVTTAYTATVIWHNNYHNNTERPAEITLVLRDNEGNTYKRPITEANADATGYTWWYTFTNLPTNLGGGPLTYEVGVETPKNYTAKILGQTIILTQVKDVPILVKWHDQRNNDRVRPNELTLELSANGVKDGTAITITGDPTGETWRGTFEQLPVWNGPLSDDEITYAWEFAGTELAEKGYSVDTHNFESATVGIETVYPIDISREIARKPVEAIVSWNDAKDQDGLRPASITVRLFAGNVDTGKAMVITGSNEADEWNTSFADMPVLEAGDPIEYFVRADKPKGYDANSTPGDAERPPVLTLAHTPETQKIQATVRWADETKEGGLTRFPISLRLMADGQALDMVDEKIVSAEESKGETDVTVTWTDVPVYYGHGKRHDNFTVQAVEAADKPADHIISVDGLTVTVKRVEFTLGGYVYNYQKSPVPTALVSVIDVKADKLLGYAITDSNGYYSFAVAPGAYLVQASVSGVNGGAASATISNLNADTTQNFTLSGYVELFNCTIKVVVNDKDPAAYAEVELSRINQGKIATLTTGEDGTVSLVLPGSSYDFQASYTTESGVCYLSELAKADIVAQNTTITINVPVEKDGKQVSGRVLDADGNPVSGIEVQCYRRGSGTPSNVKAMTNANGEFTLGGLADGTYALILKDKTGQEIVLSNQTTFTVPNDTWLNVQLPDSGNHNPAPSGYGTLSGIVTDKNGQSVGEAQVVVTDKVTGSPVNVLTTAPDGTFEAQLPVGEYTVEIRDLYDNSTDLSIRVDDLAASEENGFVTADSFTIQGVVLDEDDQPKEGVTVYLYGEDGQLIQVSTIREFESEEAIAEVALVQDEDASLAEAVISGAVAGVKEATLTTIDDLLSELEEAAEAAADNSKEDTNADLLADAGFVRMDEMVTAQDGKYVFEGLAAGRYVVKIAQGLGGNGGSTDIPVTVQPLPEIPENSGLTVTTDSYTVSGIVTGKHNTPVGNANVTLLDEQGAEVARLTTAEDGVYEFTNLPKGDYTVNVSYPDSELLTSGDVTISDGGFATFPGQLLTGAVKDNKGNALPNVIVTIRGEKATYTASADKDGNYRTVVPEGKYTVSINYQGKTAEKAVTVNGQPATADLTITITTSGGNTNPGGNTGGSGSGSTGSGSGSGGGSIGGGGGSGSGDVAEQPKVVLSGVVTDKDGNGVVGATVTAVDTKTGETYTAITGPDGKYALAVPKGSYTVTVSYGSTTTTSPKKVTASKDAKLDDMAVDNLGNWVTGYVTGYTNGTFGGERNITRSEVTALISRVSPGFDKAKTYGFDFKDVSSDVWYANNLGYCVAAGLVQGRGNGHFDPNANITRAEFAAIVARFLGLPNEVIGEVSYPDTADNWAEGYIVQLTAKGIVEGKGDGKFDPDANITRYEAVTMLNRALGRTPDKAVLDSLLGNLVIRAFPDIQPTHWAYYQVIEAAFDHYHK